ncbi:hypothetical protein KM043_014337 [Ampulex compressa]|nr:hypothetical protein KM043_014337 [Ampulex compressa]
MEDLVRDSCAVAPAQRGGAGICSRAANDEECRRVIIPRRSVLVFVSLLDFLGIETPSDNAEKNHRERWGVRRSVPNTFYASSTSCFSSLVGPH